MPSKKIAPAAIVALKEALANLYWYKADLRSFLTSTLTNSGLLSRLNWNDYKRNVVGDLVGYLDRRQGEYQADLLRLMTEVARVDSGRRLMLLMDGSDLMAVLEGRIDLIQLLLRKRREASQTGNIYVRIHEIL